VSALRACLKGAAGVRPLLSDGRRVVVDGHPICSECGRAVELVAPDAWRHGLSRRPRVTPLAQSYQHFKHRFPWVSATEDEWRRAANCLTVYSKSLKLFKRRKALPLGANPYLDLVRQLTASPSPLLDLAERRRELASLFSWAIPTDTALDVVSRYAPLVECGAGMGYWLALLRARGVDAIGYDRSRPGRKNAYHRSARRPWTEIERESSVKAARRHADRALLLCWPPYDDDAASFEVLRAYRGEVVIHIGEIASGSVRFHRELALNWTLVEGLELPHWPGIQDRVMVYRRNAVRRAHIERDRCFQCKRYIATGAIGRCEACFRRRPPALALRVGRHRIEYPASVVAAMPPALRKAFEASPALIKSASYRRSARG
jgi:hypothetical protein